MSRVLDALDTEARTAGLPQGTADRIVLVAGERIANALEHGVAGIHLRLDASATRATLYTTGEATRDDPSLPEPTATSGRGLYLIASLSDHVEAQQEDALHHFDIRSEENPLLE